MWLVLSLSMCPYHAAGPGSIRGRKKFPVRQMLGSAGAPSVKLT